MEHNMKPKDQVSNLELSKRLRELKVKQESLWCWWGLMEGSGSSKYPYIVRGKFVLQISSDRDKHHPFDEKYSAFTVAELGEMLPKHAMDAHWKCSLHVSRSGIESEYWLVGYRRIEFSGNNRSRLEAVDKTEANARAKMLIHLIEKGIVKP